MLQAYSMLLPQLPNIVQAFCSAFFFASSTPHKHTTPSLALDLQPQLSHDNSSLSVRFSIQVEPLSLGTRFLTMPLEMAHVPTTNYSASNPITASDDFGPLTFFYRDDETLHRTWYPSRSTRGTIRLSFTTYPRQITSSTRPGPRFDLREDQGGLIGTGLSFIPQLAFRPTDTRMHISLSWDLSLCPPDTKAIWSHTSALTSSITGDALSGSIFAVGPLHVLTTNISHPTHPSPARHSPFTLTYIGDPPPFSPTEVFSRLAPLYQHMATFFSPPVNPDEGYSIFLRRSTSRSFGGTAFHRAFILEYSTALLDLMAVGISNIFEILAHEMVHNWPKLEKCSEQDPCGAQRTWYTEGIAVYYAAILPYRFNLTSRAQFLTTINQNAQAYYTSPLVHLSNMEVSNLGWGTFHAQRMPYYRGFIFFVLLDSLIKQASKGSRSVDDLVLEMLRRQRSNLSYTPADFLALLNAELGQPGLAAYSAMSSGLPFIKVKDGAKLGLNLTFVRRDLPQYELGFDESSISSKRITGLVKGSRAEEAGLREGEEVMDGSLYGWTADDAGRKMRLKVRRGGEVVEVEYWPRTRHLVESWQWT